MLVDSSWPYQALFLTDRRVIVWLMLIVIVQVGMVNDTQRCSTSGERLAELPVIL